MVQMVAAGESSGGLDKAFSRVGSQFEKEAHLKGLIIKSAIYPVILILVIIVVVAIMMIKIVPTFTAQFDEVGGKIFGCSAIATARVSPRCTESRTSAIALANGLFSVCSDSMSSASTTVTPALIRSQTGGRIRSFRGR